MQIFQIHRWRIHKNLYSHEFVYGYEKPEPVQAD